MADTAFVIPTDRAELLSGIQHNYTVKNVVIRAEILDKLGEAEQSYREEGPNFILDNFDTYYSVLHHAASLPPDVIYKAYKVLHKATDQLSNTLQFLLDSNDNLNDEIKERTVNTLKMLAYIYIQFVLYLEERKKANQEDLVVGRGKNKAKSVDDFNVDKPQVLQSLNNIIQREISILWEPPIVEHDFIGLLAELCFVLLQNPSIKQEKSVIMDIFGVLGHLVKSYNFGNTFVTRLIRTIRMYEHVAGCVADGIQMVVEQFKCETLIQHFVKEATEWQIDETFQDGQGTRCCSVFLTELAITIPNLMLREVMYLNRYLAHESVPLRVAVLNVMYEIILKVLTKHGLTEEEQDLRNEIMDVIIEHLRDYSAVVRAKVIQNLTKLQKECAIPLTLQNEVLREVIKHLHDKAALARRCSITCVTTFLEHNPYGANLYLKTTEATLASKKELLNTLEAGYKQAHRAALEQRQAEWSNLEPVLRDVITRYLDDDDEENEEARQQDEDEAVAQIRIFLKEKKYAEAVALCKYLKESTEALKNMGKTGEDHEITMYITILNSVFMDNVRLMCDLRANAGITAEDIEKIEALEQAINYLEDTTEFLRILDSAIEPMKSLLFSQTASDMQEAIQFFVTAFQFQIDRSTEGVVEMLKIMRCNEPERQAAVIEAFKKIYLTTDTKSMTEHTTTILNRLLALVKDITYDNLDDFQNIVTEWTAKGILDNSIISRCWEFYTQRESVSNEDARAAAEILRMVAMGRNAIIRKNVSVVSKIMFSEHHKDHLMFLASSCRLLAVAGLEKIDVQSKDAPFKVTYTDPIFENLSNALVHNFFLKHSYYTEAMQAAIDFIFRVCSAPLMVIEKIIARIGEKLRQHPKETCLIIKMCDLLGCVALKLLGYLDTGVYRELKRRIFVREDRKKDKKNKNSKGRRKSMKQKMQESQLDTSILSDISVNESVLMGADAEDGDAEYILSILENDVVSNKGVLGQYAPLILNICQRPDQYSGPVLQEAAVTALIRYMLVSENFCRDNIRLLFTILEKTTYPALKCTILVHCSDLLTRFPNIIEPWSPRIYSMLKDPIVEVRKKAFFSLANLILRSMIRAHSHISEMAACLIDPDEEVSGMCKSFFERMSQKENNLVNVIPDIFTHLVRVEEINEERLRYILKYLFDLIDSSKRTENLVDRFCCKYTPDENVRLNRNITFCLSLINYNDKALRKMREKFPTYQHHMHDAEIYSMFNQIMTECSKQKTGKADLKPIVTEIEACIASVFDVNENGQPSKPPPVTKSTKKPKSKPKKKNTRVQDSDSDDEDDQPPTTRRKRAKTKRNSRGRTSDDSS